MIMSEENSKIKSEAVDSALGDMKIEEEASPEDLSAFAAPTPQGRLSPSQSPKDSASQSPITMQSAMQTPKSEDEEQETKIPSDITVSVEPGKPPKLSRKSSQKVTLSPAKLFDHLEDATAEASTKFQVIRDCIYGSKYMGSSEHDALGCDCSEDWHDGKNNACGEESDCINRATKMECLDDECNCGSACQNQRFQRKEYAKVSVIRTEKKGYGLRTDNDLQANDFIFEYVGEVINEPTFRRRTIQYDDEGIKHFYFMSLTKSEFVDATKKGNLGRFCNHSCNPNCYVDKWVVGDKLRMGLFAERHIKAGEELVFNYNVDRYGADPQPCYCAEPNCTGFIGGKTQTERSTKLSHTTIEALGIEDGDGWDTAIAKKPRKKKTGENDEEYVNNLQPRSLDEDGVTKVMATLMQCKEKWIAVKLLARIQRCDDDKVRNRVVRMHGYQILRTTLTAWIKDNNVVLQILDILYKFPRLTRNKIVDSKIEQTIETLKSSEHDDVSSESTRLLEEWSKLELAYRIPRKKFDPTAQQSNSFDRRGGDRDGGDRDEEAPKSPVAVVAPTGPRNSIPQRFAPARPVAPTRPATMRRPFHPLPPGWFTALDQSGNTYYYSKSGQTTWQRPTIAHEPPPPKAPPKAIADQKALQDIIDSLTKADPNAANRPPATPQPVETATTDKKDKPEKWRSLSVEKQMKLYENTLFPHIKYVMDRFRNKLPKEDLKKFAKEVGKKLVASDFKNNRVEDPTKISEKQEKKVKKYVKDYFDKAVTKKAEHDMLRAKKKAQASANCPKPKDSAANGDASETLATADPDVETKAEDSDDTEMSDDEPPNIAASVPATPNLATPTDETLKRKRNGEGTASNSPSKRIKDEVDNEPSPPPPPPPPPAEDFQMIEPAEIDGRTSEERELAAQEEALMRENEEAMKDELVKLEAGKAALDLGLTGMQPDAEEAEDDSIMREVNGIASVKMEDGEEEADFQHARERGSVDETMDVLQLERKQVLSH